MSQTKKNPTDIPDLIQEVLAKRSQRYLDINVGAIAKYLKSSSSLKSASDGLPGLTSKLDTGILGNNLAQAMMVAHLAGMDDVILDEDISRFDAVTPAYLKMPWVEAIQYFRQKLSIPLKSFKSMAEGYHQWAFSVANLENGDLLSAVRFLLDEAIAKGNSQEVFNRQFNRLVGRQGFQPGAHRIKVIFDTNVRQAYRGGRYAQTTHPDVMETRKYLVWKHRDSVVPRPLHKALHNQCILAEDPFWKTCYPSCGWGCRCGAFAVTEETAKARGYKIISKSEIPDPLKIADPGFRYAPSLINGNSLKDFQNDKLSKIPLDIRKEIKKNGKRA